MLTKSKSIPVIFGLNENYLKPMYVTISSILHYAPQEMQRPLEFYILMNKVPPQTEIMTQIFRKLGGELIFIETEIPETSSSMREHYTKDTFFRYLIPDMFSSEYEKAIYLDADIVARNNIFSMFDHMQEKNGLAVHIEYPHKDWVQHRISQESRNSLNIPQNSPFNLGYFNAGVMGFNFKNLPQNFLEKCLSYTKSDFSFYDQDALNILVLKENIHLCSLPNTYNLQPEFYESGDPNLIHFMGPNKPWQGGYRTCADFWMAEKEYLAKKIHEKASAFFPLLLAKEEYIF